MVCRFFVVSLHPISQKYLDFMIKLEENKGIPGAVILMMAAIAGLSVANLYYNQPLLEIIREELSITQVEANLITVVTQAGYALGLLFIVPLGDMVSRRMIILVNMIGAAVMALVIALSHSALPIWIASLVIGACSVVPQFFIPIAGQFSRPGEKDKIMGYVLTGLLTGILASRVISGMVGNLYGWRIMFFAAAVIMVVCCVVTLRFFPDMKKNFHGSYPSLMKTVVSLFTRHRVIRLNSIRAGLGMGSMLAFWSCLAFHLAGEPFHAGSEMVGFLGGCGIAGALVSMNIGKFIPKYGAKFFCVAGTVFQLAAWSTAFLYGDTYVGLIAAVILVDIGLQCQQLSNQGGCIREVPEAANRANTIFMTCFFVGGASGTFLAGLAWGMAGWTGVCCVGVVFALSSLAVSLVFDHSSVFVGRKAVA